MQIIDDIAANLGVGQDLELRDAECTALFVRKESADKIAEEGFTAPDGARSIPRLPLVLSGACDEVDIARRVEYISLKKP